MSPSQRLVDKTIESHSNTIYSDWRDLLLAKGIKKQGEFLISGDRAVRDTLERVPQLARSLILCADRHVPSREAAMSGPSSGPNSWQSLIERARELTKKNEPRFSVISLARPLFDALDVSGTHAPILVAKTPPINEAKLKEPPEGLELMCALGDPSNVGAVLRSAAAFGVSRVILLKECASPFHPKAVRSASAATLLTPLVRGPSILDLPVLAADGALHGPVLALDMKGHDVGDYKWPKSARLLLGEEGQGVPPSSKFEYLAIPMQPGVESLNATIAASIALFASHRSRSR
ncbi:MAG: RNA methyltransferase [Bdellovibrionota bacterium]